MDKPSPAAATMQSCLLRLQSLQQHFLHIDSPQELTDAEQDGGHILAQLLHHQHIDPDILIPNSRGRLLDYAAGALATRKNNGRLIDNGLAEGYQLKLWQLLVWDGSDQQRKVLHPVYAGDRLIFPPQCSTATLPTEVRLEFEKAFAALDKADQLDKGVTQRGEPVLHVTCRDKDYKQQGKRYALFTSELLARIQAAPPLPEQEQGTTGKPKRIRGLSKQELEPIVAAILAPILATDGTQRKLTAEDVYKLATEAGHKTSEPQIKKTRAWEVYADWIGTSRQPKTPKEYCSDKLDVMADETRQMKRTGRKAKPIEPEE
jgi:hypothetical protein